jgi:ubiquinone biosynthesis protein
MATSQEASVENIPLLAQTTGERSYPFQTCFRSIEIVACLCFHTARFFCRLLWSKVSRKPRSRDALLGQSITELCNALGATFIKIGQILSTRCDLFPPELIEPLIMLQDGIKPFAFRKVLTIVQTQYGSPLQEVFAEFEEQPVSSASIASVYRARLHNGSLVAVKIRRPDIKRKVRDDIRLMRFMARGMARLPAMRLVPVVDMINELGDSIEQQIDLRIEARNNRRFREQLAEDTLVQVPALVEEYCNEAILVMDFIPDLVRIDELDWTEAEYQEALITGLRALYTMIFLDGFIHCDMHPGNFFLRRGGGVVILDTGFIARLNDQDRRHFARFFLGISTNAGRDCARILYETSSYQSDTFEREGFDLAVIELINRTAGSKAAAFQVATFAFQIFDIQRRFGLRGSTNFTMAILSLLIFEGIAKQLYPQLDFQSEARSYVLQGMLLRQPE